MLNKKDYSILTSLFSSCRGVQDISAFPHLKKYLEKRGPIYTLSKKGRGYIYLYEDLEETKEYAN